ncbi:hypothetical protein INT47_002382 [Mucor saturninus]|uniref:Uncharacterized protein n=1 Tax=Mucor saturninus TaxID=64648 RepID=A0A8H7V7U1_9FUNG|nr:hypothetical protein INT47_002382 [Mucor saturninus]
MFIGELTDAYVTAAPQFRVTARNVTLESKCADSGVKPMVDDERIVLPIKAKKIKISDFLDKPPKLTYAVYRFVWDNINDPTIVVGKSDKTVERNVEAFAVSFHDMHEHLVERRIIPQNCNPVSINEAISRPRTNATGRPVLRTMSTVYSYNTIVRKTIWDAPCLSLENLMNKKLPFLPNIFIKTSTAAMET